MFPNVISDEECQVYCNITTGCKFFVFKKHDIDKCYLYNQGDQQKLLEGCNIIYGPVRPDIESCNNVNNPCSVRNISIHFSN